eukprot:UN01688
MAKYNLSLFVKKSIYDYFETNSLNNPTNGRVRTNSGRTGKPIIEGKENVIYVMT